MDATNDLWQLIESERYFDRATFTEALKTQVENPPWDYRTRLLIRDSVHALEQTWGKSNVEQWLQGSGIQQPIKRICAESFERVGFPSLAGRIVEPTRPKQIRRFLREIDARLQQPQEVYLGGSGALILQDKLNRATEGLDLVDQVPKAIREQHDLLDELNKQYGLQLTHFQSHYLPEGWKNRVQSVGPFQQLSVFIVDAIDIFVGKLFSNRNKDREDLPAISNKLDFDVVKKRVAESTVNLKSDPKMKQQAEKNWYILFGENELP